MTICGEKLEEIEMEMILAGDCEVAKALKPEVAIEAEWGSDFVDGSKLSLNHHGVNSSNPAPCVAEFSCDGLKESDVVVFSHVDLDSIGGILNVLRDDIWLDNKRFWRVVAFVDVNGPHRLGECEHLTGCEEDRVYAWWAWSQENRAPRCQKGESIDISGYLEDCFDVLRRILGGDKELLELGKEFKRKERELNERSYVESCSGVAFRVSDSFVNHLYKSSDGVLFDVVVAYNTKFKSITISSSGANDAIDCCSLIQRAFGKEAGGHKGIAGSPRGVEYSVDDAEGFYRGVVEWVK